MRDSRLLLIDKPEGPTSHDIVDLVRKRLGVKKAGHCGTLDPMASGLLLLLTGRATRMAEVFGDHEKTYRGTVTLGAATDTDDPLGWPQQIDGEIELGDGSRAPFLQFSPSRIVAQVDLPGHTKVGRALLVGRPHEGRLMPEDVEFAFRTNQFNVVPRVTWIDTRSPDAALAVARPVRTQRS